MEQAEFWDWARRVVDESHRDGYLQQQVQMADPELGHLYKRPLGFDLVQRGCLGFITVLEIGLGVAWGAYRMKSPPGEEAPPTFKFQRRSWLFRLLSPI